MRLLLKSCRLVFITSIVLAFISSCSSENSDDPGYSDQINDELWETSFTYQFKEDSPYERTYDIAFLRDGRFEFSATAHGTTGETFGRIVDDYSHKENLIEFYFGARGFIVNSSYVKPIGAKIIREDQTNKIEKLEITIQFESFQGKITYSYLDFFPSDYVPITKVEIPKLTDSDFSGKIWHYGNKQLLLCEDGTMFGGESWTFDKKKQILSIKWDEKSEISYIQILRGNNESFVSADKTIWTGEAENDFYPFQYLSGDWITATGKTLQLTGSSKKSMSGDLTPDLPNNTSRKKYDDQYMINDSSNGLEGIYKIRYEGQEIDIINWIPWSKTVSGGTWKISNPRKSSKNRTMTLTGVIAGDFVPSK